jgi:hypothetical protein
MDGVPYRFRIGRHAVGREQLQQPAIVGGVVLQVEVRVDEARHQVLARARNAFSVAWQVDAARRTDCYDACLANDDRLSRQRFLARHRNDGDVHERHRNGTLGRIRRRRVARR